MYRHVYTLRSLPGSFAEPSCLCPSHTSERTGGRHIAFYATDSVYNRIVRVERLEDMPAESSSSSSSSSPPRRTEKYGEEGDDVRDLTWGYTVVTGAGNFSAPRGVISIPTVRYRGSAGLTASGPPPHVAVRGSVHMKMPIGDVLLVCDSGHNRVKIMCTPGPRTGHHFGKSGRTRIATLVGNGQRGHTNGQGNNASFDAPSGACILNDGSLLVVDSRNNCVRRIAPYSGQLPSPRHGKQGGEPVATEHDRSGSVHFSPLGSHRRRANGRSHHKNDSADEDAFSHSTVKEFDRDQESVLSIITRWACGDMGGGVDSLGELFSVTTVAGGGASADRRKPGLEDGDGSSALFFKPSAIVTCASGAVVVCDQGNNCLRVMLPTENPNIWSVVTPHGAEFSAPVPAHPFHGARNSEVVGDIEGGAHVSKTAALTPARTQPGALSETPSGTLFKNGNDRILHPETRTVPWRMLSPSGIGVLNGDGHHGEVVIVSHKHGLSAVALDLHTMQIIANNLIAGKQAMAKPLANRRSKLAHNSCKHVSVSFAEQSRMRSNLGAVACKAGGVNWRKEFQLYDRDNSGEIDFQEFVRLIRKNAKISKTLMPDKAVKNIFAVVDTDGNGIIDLSEFLVWMKGSFNISSNSDTNNRNGIDRDDLRGHVDGEMNRSYFDCPTGVLVRPDQSLLVADTGNAVVRHLQVGSVTAERFWESHWAITIRNPRKDGLLSPLSTGRRSRRKTPRFRHHGSPVSAGRGAAEEDLQTAAEKAKDLTELKGRHTASRKKKLAKKKSIGSRLVASWASGNDIAENFLQDMQGMLQEKTGQENGGNDGDNASPSSSPSGDGVPPAPSSNHGRLGVPLPGSRSSKKVRNGARVNSARGWRLSSIPNPIKVRSKGGHAVPIFSTSASAKTSRAKITAKKAREKHARFVGLRGVRRTRLEMQEARLTRRRLAESEKRKKQEKRVPILTKGQGRVASGRSSGVRITGSAKKSDMSVSDACVMKFHPRAKSLAPSQGHRDARQASASLSQRAGSQMMKVSRSGNSVHSGNNREKEGVKRKQERKTEAGRCTAPTGRSQLGLSAGSAQRSSVRSSSTRVDGRPEWNTSSKSRHRRPSSSYVARSSQNPIDVSARESTSGQKPIMTNALFMKSTLSSRRRHMRNESKIRPRNTTTVGSTNSGEDPLAHSPLSIPPSRDRAPLDFSASVTPLISLVSEAQHRAEKLIHLVNASMDL